MSICAVDYRNTPAFGVSPAIAEHFSGQGITPIYFDAQGTALSASLRLLKPDICAPDATDTSFFGADMMPDSDLDGNGLPNFQGTSAAAPHAAAVAALMLQQNSALKPDAIYALMRATAYDMPYTPTVLEERSTDRNSSSSPVPRPSPSPSPGQNPSPSPSPDLTPSPSPGSSPCPSPDLNPSPSPGLNPGSSPGISPSPSPSLGLNPSPSPSPWPGKRNLLLVSSPERDDTAATADSAAAAAAAAENVAAAAAGPRQVNGTVPAPNWLQWDRRSGYGFIAADKLLTPQPFCADKADGVPCTPSARLAALHIARTAPPFIRQAPTTPWWFKTNCSTTAWQCKGQACTSVKVPIRANIGVRCNDNNPCTSNDRCNAQGVCAGTGQ